MLPLQLQPAIDILVRSLDYATQLARDPWDFAVEIDALRELGLSNNDLRWLLCKGWVRHAAETARPEIDGRSFTPVSGLVLNDRCCFILTPAGATAARPSVPVPSTPVVLPATIPPGEPTSARPEWDKDRRLLRFGPQVVKQFKVPAPNQEVILITFQEEEWAVRIDDPLPMAAGIDPKRRLHDTINSLNRNQRVPLLRFFGDGSGMAICWEMTRENGSCSHLAAAFG